MLKDSFGRQILDLRISVTDRCNFKCSYCKTAKGVNYVEREKLLSYEEIERVSRLCVELGIEKLRITGGEPLLRKGLETLVAGLSAVPGVKDLALTTNGFNLHEHAVALKQAGLKRVTISLDSLDEGRFFEITRSRDFSNVLKSIEVAQQVGLGPVKVNCVVVGGFNDDEILDFAEFGRTRGIDVRFIEFMPLDEDEKWDRSLVVTGAHILKVIASRYEIVQRTPLNSSETSVNYNFAAGKGSVGVIMPVSRPFCGECSRLRLTADGHLRTCLFSHVEYDIKERLRGGASDSEIKQFISEVTLKKEPGHRINESDFKAPSRSMSYIGG